MAKPAPVIALGALILLAGCGTPAAQAPRPSTTPTATLSPRATATPLPSCADRVFAGMTEDQRIGQLFLLGLTANQLGPAEVNEIQADHVGSVWFVDRTSVGAPAIRRVADAVQAQASAAATANVRFFVAANQ
ncbi:MAG TPA: hypothetical protein VJO72_12845, partial [Candidatus Dormibacteraeota bacterium]|nr:hypothetical protein [Candidatus Dormibacteraeota bacterium]